jgi:ubiquinone/menaquinone biosynthesis C-methylase UbiE
MATDAPARALYPHILGELKKRQFRSLLDVACGSGDLLTQVGTSATLAGLEPSAEMVSAAKKQLGDRADVREGQASKVPWGDATFDVITSIGAFRGYDPAVVLKEFARVLRPSGFIIIADQGQPKGGIGKLLKVLRGSGGLPIYTEQDWRTMLGQAGFLDIDWRPIGNDSYMVRAKRKSLT